MDTASQAPRPVPVDEFNALDFEFFPALIWRSGLDTLCDYFNQTWLAFTGRSQEAEQGNGWTEGVHPEDLDACVQTYLGCFSEKRAFSMEYRLRHHSGEYRWIKDLGTPRYNRNGEFLGYLGACYDVSAEREAAKNLQRMSQNKSKLFSLVAHDLKGPIGAVAHLAQSLVEKQVPPDEQEATARILATSATTLQALLESLLTWAQTQLEGFRPVLGPVDFSAVAREATAPLAASLVKKRQTLDLSTALAPPVLGDFERLKTVFRNLVSNASKFSPPDTILRVEWAAQGTRLVVRVVDRGVGMSQETLDALWIGGLVRSQPGTAGEKGNGLGLAICREFVEAQGGTLEVLSDLGHGTTVVVNLPLA